MSKYTTEVRFICEVNAGLTESKGFNDVDSIIESAAPKVFSFNFPMFDEAYRLPLEIKILRHFYTREICEETVGLWKLRLQDKLNMIMPYYNQLYKSELLDFNPFYDVDLTREHTIEHEGNESRSDSGTKTKSEVVDTDTTDNSTQSGTVRDENTRWDLFSDTPQGGINGITADNDSVANNTYLTNARKITDNNLETTSNTNNATGTVDTTVSGNEQTTNTGTTALTSTEDYIEHVKGKQAGISYSKMLEEFRQTFLNIDKMVIDELNDLFFGLW